MRPCAESASHRGTATFESGIEDFRFNQVFVEGNRRSFHGWVIDRERVAPWSASGVRDNREDDVPSGDREEPVALPRPPVERRYRRVSEREEVALRGVQHV